jgi:hypothetical protein
VSANSVHCDLRLSSIFADLNARLLELQGQTGLDIELTYSSRDMEPFAAEYEFDGLDPTWNSERRSLLRAELDAYYAYLYGLTKRELQYILSPTSVMGEDYPSETFRVLKENEIREFGEFRTERLVLEAWDRFVADGTFDPVRLREPQYIDRVADELAATREKLEATEQNARQLLALASASPKPTLFVEGVTDVAIIQAAWSVFFPTEPIPVKVLSAGGSPMTANVRSSTPRSINIVAKRPGSSKRSPEVDLDALRKTVEDAAAVSAGFWLSYLFVLFYIGIAAGAVTHKDLLLENPVKLPFLSVDLPLVAFFVLAPILFIVSHAYTLVHFVMLGAKVGVFDTELRAQLGGAPETREGLRRQLPSNIFVQISRQARGTSARAGWGSS